MVENGSKKAYGKYKNQFPIGKHLLWYPNGKLKSSTNFIMANHMVQEWNGTIMVKKEVGQFSNGKESGTWTYYNKDGTVDGTEEY